MSKAPIRPIESQLFLPDLRASGLNIVTRSGSNLIYVSAIVDNIGLGSARGPFAIQIAVNMMQGEVVTSYVQTFEVPASVTLHGRPVFELALARGITEISNPFQTRYETGNMEVPLEFRDGNPSTTYTAEFIVDPYYQVDDPDRANNTYTWPGSLWWLSPDARAKKGPHIIKQTHAARK